METNESALTVKRAEREYAVDPLFQKRSAIFDSGGAKGLLLNVLSVHNGYELVFDSLDMVEDTIVDGAGHAVGGETESELCKLIQMVLPNNWHEQEICPEYAERKKGSVIAMVNLLGSELPDEDPFMVARDSTLHATQDIPPTSVGLTSSIAEGASNTQAHVKTSDEDGPIDFVAAALAGGNGGDSSAMDVDRTFDNYDQGGGGYASDDPDVVPFTLTEGGMSSIPGSQNVLEARLNRIEAREHEVEAMDQPALEFYAAADDPNAEYTYFNREKLATWEGPGHWKHKVKASKKSVAEDDEYMDEDGNVVKAAKTRGPRKMFKLDFSAPAPENLAALLQPAGASPHFALLHLSFLCPSLFTA